jgi:hypothetical protein
LEYSYFPSVITVYFSANCLHLFRLTWSSPAPEANEDLAKEKLYGEMAKAKNAPASGVGWSAWLARPHDFFILTRKNTILNS